MDNRNSGNDAQIVLTIHVASEAVDWTENYCTVETAMLKGNINRLAQSVEGYIKSLHIPRKFKVYARFDNSGNIWADITTVFKQEAIEVVESELMALQKFCKAKMIEHKNELDKLSQRDPNSKLEPRKDVKQVANFMKLLAQLPRGDIEADLGVAGKLELTHQKTIAQKIVLEDELKEVSGTVDYFKDTDMSVKLLKQEGSFISLRVKEDGHRNELLKAQLNKMKVCATYVPIGDGVMSCRVETEGILKEILWVDNPNLF